MKDFSQYTSGKNNLMLKEIFEQWTKTKKVEEIVDMVLAKGIPAGPIYDLKDIVHDEHIAGAREMIVKTHHPVMGDIILNGNPVKLMDTMPEIYKPSPTLGEDTAKILNKYLDIPVDEVEKLKKELIV